MSPERLDAIVGLAIRWINGGRLWLRPDLMQEGMLIAWQMRDVAATKPNPDAFLVRVVRNRLVDLLRQQNGRREANQRQRYAGAIPPDLLDRAAGPDVIVDARDEWEHVRQQIDPSDARVIERCVIHGDWPKGAGFLSAMARVRRLLGRELSE